MTPDAPGQMAEAGDDVSNRIKSRKENFPMSFDFTALARGLAILSLGGIGVIMTGSFLFPELAERYKKQIINVVIGLILVAISGSLVGYF